jgi:propionate CoA-transferase
VRDYVGPGGFIDLTTAARTIVFVSGWTVHGEIVVERERVRIARGGAPKFVSRVGEITFSGPRAVAAGKRVFFATPVGLFRLTRRGMKLASIMPGIDVARDILEVSPMRLIVPDPDELTVVPRAVVSGDGFALSLRR